MINMKRVIAVTLSVLLTTGSLIACNPDTDDSDNGTTTKTTTTTTEQKEDPGQTTEDTTSDETEPNEPDDSGEPADTDDGEEPPVLPAETRTIRYASHNIDGLDPHRVDEITGEYTMDPERRQAALDALDAVKEQLNVEIEYILYPSDVREIILQSVLAGDPIADVTLMWGGSEGTILPQNVLQSLNPYVEDFRDPEYDWMLTDEIFDNMYFLNMEIMMHPAWPLIYNVSLIEEVPALKENGETVYPTDLFERGDWTWSTFEDYLTKIDAHFADSQAPTRPERRVEAYQTDWRFAARSAAYANGGYTFNSQGIGVAKQEFKDAMDWIKKLYDEELLVSEVYDNSVVPLWTDFAYNLGQGETVFTDAAHWRLPEVGSLLAERGQSMGIVPYPRADRLEPDSEEYNQVMSVADTIGIPKGIDEETTQLALDTMRLYYNAYYKSLGDVDSIPQYREEAAVQYAATKGFDILHEKNGEGIINAFIYISNNVHTNDFGNSVGIASDQYGWDMLLNNVIMGTEGYPNYSTAVDENIDSFTNTVAQLGDILSQDEIRDNIAPSINLAEDVEQPLAFAKGTDLSTVDWSEYVEAEDGVDGVLDMNGATIDTESVDTETVGTYDQGLVVKIQDAAENEAEAKYNMAIFDPENTDAPTLAIREDYRDVELEEDTAEINWLDFVETAEDADGIDIRKNVSADLSTLDTTTPGTYTVTLSVQDYAGNENTADVDINVVAGEEN